MRSLAETQSRIFTSIGLLPSTSPLLLLLSHAAAALFRYCSCLAAGSRHWFSSSIAVASVSTVKTQVLFLTGFIWVFVVWFYVGIFCGWVFHLGLCGWVSFIWNAGLNFCGALFLFEWVSVAEMMRFDLMI